MIWHTVTQLTVKRVINSNSGHVQLCTFMDTNKHHHTLKTEPSSYSCFSWSKWPISTVLYLTTSWVTHMRKGEKEEEGWTWTALEDGQGLAARGHFDERPAWVGTMPESGPCDGSPSCGYCKYSLHWTLAKLLSWQLGTKQRCVTWEARLESQWPRILFLAVGMYTVASWQSPQRLTGNPSLSHYPFSLWVMLKLSFIWN